MTMTPEQVTEILDHLKDANCESFELTIGDSSLQYRRAGAATAAVAPPAAPTVAPSAPPAPAAVKQAAPASAPAPSRAGAAAPPATVAGADVIEAPLSGVFYRRPAPSEPAFVDVGSMVAPGDPICVIEVMKLFSTVHAEVAGRVVAIHVDDAASVEKGTPLFSIDPRG